MKKFENYVRRECSQKNGRTNTKGIHSRVSESAKLYFRNVR